MDTMVELGIHDRDAEIAKLRTENERLRRIIHLPLTEVELKLVDKNCDWIAFKHAWNAILKSRGVTE